MTNRNVRTKAKVSRKLVTILLKLCIVISSIWCFGRCIFFLSSTKYTPCTMRQFVVNQDIIRVTKLYSYHYDVTAADVQYIHCQTYVACCYIHTVINIDQPDCCLLVIISSQFRFNSFKLTCTTPSCLNSNFTVSEKKRANFKTVYLEIIMIDFGDIWQKCPKYSRIEFACFSFRVGLLFINFSSFKQDTGNMTSTWTFF